MATPQGSGTQMHKRKNKGRDGLHLGLDIGIKAKRQRSHRYRGHRANSFVPSSDIPLLVELRARHRTFQGAYARTALGNLGYALTILRLFDTRFYRIGLIFAILGALLLVISFARDRHSRHDFADPQMEEDEAEDEGGSGSIGRGEGAGTNGDAANSSRAQDEVENERPKRKDSLMAKLSGSINTLSRFRLRRRPPIPTFTPTPPARIFGRPFVTAGWIVIAVTLVVLATEVGLMVMIIKL